MTRRTLAVVLVVLLATSLITPLVAADGTMTTIDDDHNLTTDSAITAYETEGVATSTLVAPDMRLTVATSADDVGLSSWTRADSLNAYLRIEYNETVDREIRFFVPNDYFYPRVLQPHEGSSETPACSPGVARRRCFNPTRGRLKRSWRVRSRFNPQDSSETAMNTCSHSS